MNKDNISLILSSVHKQTPILDQTIITEITNYINNYRKLNSAPPLKWDNTVAAFSQKWSNYLLTNHLFQHSGTQKYGENLAYFGGYGTDILTLLKLAVDMWYNEIKMYDFNNPGFSEATGHFTCLVWKSSTTFGMGISINPSSGTVDIVMNTSPPGNVIGEFAQNVLPSVGTPSPTTPVPVPVVVPPSLMAPGTCPSCTQMDQIMIVTSLYNILNDMIQKKPNALIISEIKNLINNIGTV